MQISGKSRDGACPHRCGETDMVSDTALLSLAGSSQEEPPQHALPLGSAENFNSDTQIVLDEPDEQPLLV